MKKLFLLLLPGMLLLAGNAEAQIQKGTRYWGTTVSFSGDNVNNTVRPDVEQRYHTFYVTPYVQTGWFFKENSMFGIGLSTQIARSRLMTSMMGVDVPSGSNALAVTLSPSLRRYKFLAPKWAIFLTSELDLSYLRSKNFYEDFKQFENGYSGFLSVNPGISFWVTPRFALESNINVLSLGIGYTDMQDKKSFSFSTGVNSSISQYFGIKATWYIQPQ